MSEPRKCQFFLRGRCQREKCEFSHVMPSNSSLTTTANGSNDQQSGNSKISMKSAAPCRFYQAGNCKFGESCRFAHSESSAFARGKAPFIANKSKAPMPEHKGNPDSDDESIMRKGGDSDDDAESVGSGFTSIAFEKPLSSMLPPTSTPAPKERFIRDPIMNKSNTVENQEKGEQSKRPAAVQIDETTTHSKNQMLSKEHEDISKSRLEDTQEISVLTESVAARDESSMSTTVEESPPLARQGNIALGVPNVNVQKDHNKKEIRRDSKTGFEKFDDYFDSDFDNTTLKSQNVTTANDPKEDTDATLNATKLATIEKSNVGIEKIVQAPKESEEGKNTEEVLRETAATLSEKDIPHATKVSAALPENKELDNVTQSSSIQKEISEENILPGEEKSLLNDSITEIIPDAQDNEAPKELKKHKKETTIETANEKNRKAVPVRQQPTNDVEKRQQATTNNVTSTPADLSKDWDMDDDGSVEEVPEASNTDSDKVATTAAIPEAETAERDTAAETIENIESFIQDEPKETSTPAPYRSNNGQSIASVTTTPKLGRLEVGNKVGEKRKLERTVGKRTEEWVTMIFGDDGKQIDGSDRKAAVSAKNSKKSVYDLNPDGEDFSIDEQTPFTTKVAPKIETMKETPKTRKDVISKRSGVTKIGNNTYYYTGPKGEGTGDSQDEDVAEEEEEIGHVDDGEDDDMDDEPQTGVLSSGVDEHWTGEDEDDEETSVTTPKKRKVASKSYDSGRKKHNTTYVYGARSTAAKTRRCGECEGCNREDCGKCVTCLDKPKFGGKNSKKQACVYRLCAWKNPSGKRIKPGTAPVAAPPIAPDATTSPAPVRTMAMAVAARERENKSNNAKTENSDSSAVQKGLKRGRKSISVISPASVPKRQALDEDLPQFDPKGFKKGYTPPVVKKGEDEYAIIVSGVQDTGLCGKYWSDLDNLPTRRRYENLSCTFKDPKPEVVQGPGALAKPAKTENALDDEKPRTSGRGRPSKTSRKQTLTPQEMMKDPEDESQDEKQNPKHAKVARARRKITDSNNEVKDAEVTENGEPSPLDKSINNSDNTVETSTKSVIGTAEDATEAKRIPTSGPETSTGQSDKNHESLNKPTGLINTSENGGSSQASRSVSCVADTNSQREVVVECFAPYDDHRWVNIGKERDGMSPDAVQYARALRPPYHLLSFLRIKGHSTKGMSCTDKNTMVFVVLEGEITVVLHTTQFNAKKGDSFYIPPKNYYNLINQNAREAELSLIQFQYDGPLPTVAAGSQSGTSKPPSQGSTTSLEKPEASSDMK